MQRFAFILMAFFAGAAHAAESTKPFSQTLTAEQKLRLGLAGLSAAQLAELDAAVGAYSNRITGQRDNETTGRTTPRQGAPTPVVQSSGGPVDLAKQEPGVIARTLDVFKRKQDENQREHFTGRVVGEFRGWSGGTYFPLDNGQVWRQTGTENNVLLPLQNAEVEIYKSDNGYWRLKYDGAWITVKRLQ